jgi:ion channel-forming bestrophin family protein
MLVAERIPWAFIVRRNFVSLAIVLLFATGATLLEHLVQADLPRMTTPISMVGVAVGSFLTFRNSAAYDRYWEGRKTWGSIVNTSRIFARQVVTLMHPRASEQHAIAAERNRVLVHGMIAYAHALRCALRREDPWPTITSLLPTQEVPGLRQRCNLANGIIQMLERTVAAAALDGNVSEQRLFTIDRSLAELSNAQGACERIQNTPLPASYSLVTRRIIQLYCALFPFGLAEGLHVFTILISYAVGLIFVLLDGIGRELEHPFGAGPLQLPLDAISRTIEIDLRQTLGETSIPKSPEPIRGILY